MLLSDDAIKLAKNGEHGVTKSVYARLFETDLVDLGDSFFYGPLHLRFLDYYMINNFLPTVFSPKGRCQFGYCAQVLRSHKAWFTATRLLGLALT